MREVSRFRLQDGSSVCVEIDSDERVDEVFIDSHGVYEPRFSFSQATSSIGSTVSELLAGLVHSNLQPDDVQIEFSVRVSPREGATIVEGSDTGHFRISASWKSTERYPAGPEH
ncbi:CU044_2847 family protein [Streptomyces phaeochromogenes]|jgi:hypothetical protein|uniref:CU044_2847 family protein n=1 Tax=Streptomyces phaeochromogenes TaxID=1923 RepID=UPI0006E29DBE|nr:CU044_2847 family protein [Streptomyces phaeochromogenes]